MSEFYGKYRGKIQNNVDPLLLGRVQVSCPAVLGDGTMSWAMPCVPFAGSGVGLFALPPVGANVWVEFEGGSPDHPIWSGCFWGQGEVPASPAVAQVVTLKTAAGTLTFSELPAGTITLETPAGMKLTLGPTGIELSNGSSSIKLTGPQISLNDGALEVT